MRIHVFNCLRNTHRHQSTAPQRRSAKRTIVGRDDRLEAASTACLPVAARERLTQPCFDCILCQAKRAGAGRVLSFLRGFPPLRLRFSAFRPRRHQNLCTQPLFRALSRRASVYGLLELRTSCLRAPPCHSGLSLRTSPVVLPTGALRVARTNDFRFPAIYPIIC